MKPVAVRKGLIVQPFGAELLIYQENSDEAHCLNSVVATIWKHCDGTHGLRELATAVHSTLATEVDEAAVLEALDCLRQAGLLDEASLPPMSTPVTRRSLFRRVCVSGGMMAASAAIVSMVAPTPAQAQTPATGVSPPSPVSPPASPPPPPPPPPPV